MDTDKELHSFQLIAERLFGFDHPEIGTTVARTAGFVDYAEIYVNGKLFAGSTTIAGAIDEAKRILDTQ